VDVRLAMLFCEIDRSAHYVYEACASVRQFGERHGFSGREAMVYVAAGRAMEHEPEIAPRLLAGRISLDAAATLAPVLADPALRRDDDWLAEAEQRTTFDLSRKVKERIVEVRHEEPASTILATVPASGRVLFERARTIASRKERKPLSEGETVVVLSDHYLESFDDARKKPRPRRKAAGNGRSLSRGTSRSIPSTEKRAIRGRGERCQFPGCDHLIFLDHAHRVPHAAGGSREASNLLLLCRLHHVLYDAGWIRVEGPSDRPEFYERVRTEGERSWRKVESIRAPPG